MMASFLKQPKNDRGFQKSTEAHGIEMHSSKTRKPHKPENKSRLDGMHVEILPPEGKVKYFGQMMLCRRTRTAPLSQLGLNDEVNIVLVTSSKKGIPPGSPREGHPPLPQVVRGIVVLLAGISISLTFCRPHRN